MRQNPLALLGLLVCCLSGSSVLATETDGSSGRDPFPNVIVILTDDQGWGDLSAHGNRNLSTPHLDSLKQEGISMDAFYVCPVCSPTRAEFLTGRYHPRMGVHGTSAGAERMSLDETTLAEVFAQNGYRTAAFGKWHNGSQFPYHPNARGFEEFYGFCSGHWGDYYSPSLDHNGYPVRGNGFMIDEFTDHAIDFIRAQRDNPFFVYLAYNTPHSPMQVPDRWWEPFREKELVMHHRDPGKEDQLHTRAALAMCENIDWNVGRLLQSLKDLDLEEETIVVYFCDNGPNGFRWNGGMKGRKGSTDEGGIRSPLFVRWKGQLPEGYPVSQIGGAIDLFPTLVSLCGLKHGSLRHSWDGVDLSPWWKGEIKERNDRRLFSHWNGRVSVRMAQYRLDSQGKLFDLDKDPGQQTDLSEGFPDKVQQLQREIKQWSEDVGLGRTQELLPFPVGHPARHTTFLPARDAVSSGNIRRSNRFPNSSYFLDWNDETGRLTWEIDLLRQGEYEISVEYACGKESVGGEYQFRVGEEKVAFTIAKANDTPEIGKDHDRVPRVEFYVKNFVSMAVGTINLEQGTFTLSLETLDLEGEVGIQVGGIRLKWLE